MHCTLHNTHWILYTQYYTLYTSHYKQNTANNILHTTNYTLHTEHYTVHTTHYTSHCTSSFPSYCTYPTLQIIVHTLPCTLQTKQFKCDECGIEANRIGDVNKHINIYCHICFSVRCAGSSVTSGWQSSYCTQNRDFIYCTHCTLLLLVLQTQHISETVKMVLAFMCLCLCLCVMRFIFNCAIAWV